MRTLEALALLHDSERKYVTYFILYKSIVNDGIPSTRDKNNNYSIEWKDVDTYFIPVPDDNINVAELAKETGLSRGSIWHRIRKLNLKTICPLRNKGETTGMCFISKEDYQKVLKA